MNDSARELERRVDQIVLPGVISEVQHESGLCRVSFGDRVSPLSPWIMGRCGLDKEYWHPDIGEQAIFFSPYGDGSEGFVMVGVMSDKFPLPVEARERRHIIEYEDGTRYMVDSKDHVVEWKDSHNSAVKMHDGYIDLMPAIKVRILQGGAGRVGLYLPDGTFRAIEPAREGE